MTVRIELRQTRSLESGPLYRVNNEVIYASGIQKAIFVFTVVDEEFSHVAYPYDMVNVPVGKEAAASAGNNFYRQATVTRDYESVDDATEFAVHSRERVDLLADTYAYAVDGFQGEDDFVYED